MYAISMNRLLCLFVASAIVFSSQIAFAQLTPTNESGVTMGHVHLMVPDPEAHKKFWVDMFGAQVAQGVKLDLAYRDVPQIGLKIAFVTDPVGTRIELTEGLADKVESAVHFLKNYRNTLVAQVLFDLRDAQNPKMEYRGCQ